MSCGQNGSLSEVGPSDLHAQSDRVGSTFSHGT